MKTRSIITSGFLIGLFLACFGMSMITPGRAAYDGNIGVINTSVTYTGGATQEVYVDANASVTGGTFTNNSWTLYHEDGSPVSGTGSTGPLTETQNYHFTATINVAKFNESTYFVNTFISDGAGGNNGSSNSSTFQIKHVDYFAAAPSIFYSQDTDTLIILSVPFYTSQDLNANGLKDDLVPESMMASSPSAKQWVLYDVGGAVIGTGNLYYNEGKWGSAGAEIHWKNGNFTVGAKFTLMNGTTLETPAGYRAPFTRNNATEWYIILFSILGGAAVVIFVGIAVYNKRNASRDLGTKKEKKEKKEIKVLEISKDEIKKAKAGKAPPPKEEAKEEPKGITKKSGDLIFEVPKWEEGDADK